MTSFFVRWQLWQQMTFVLASCIVVVYLIAFVKLWRTNRQMRSHELIDEERRARIAEMSYCDIRYLSRPTVPFGLRALEQGVEVEGIWNTCRGTSAVSQAASSASTAAEHKKHTQHKGGALSYHYQQSLYEADNHGESSSSAVNHSPAPFARCQVCRPVCYPDNTADDKKAWSLSVNEDAKAPAQTGSGKASFQGSVASFTLPPKQLARSRALSLDSSSARIAYGKRPVYGSAQVYVNREHRELNSGFEVLPAGMLGVRPEIPFNRPGSALDKDERTSSSMRTTKRLYKQRC